jgi:hypothetical protein
MTSNHIFTRHCPPQQAHLKPSAIALPLVPSNPAILPPWPQLAQNSLAAFESVNLALNAKGQMTIGGWLTPLVSPPHPSTVLASLNGDTVGDVVGQELAALKRRRVSVHAAAANDDDGDGNSDNESHVDDMSSSSSSSSSRQSSAPPSPKYDEGISFLPTPTPCAPSPSSPSSASVHDIQLQVCSHPLNNTWSL